MEAALSLARERRPLVLLADAVMPRLDGITLSRLITEAPETRTLPVILTAFPSEAEDLARGLRWADDFIIKPGTEQEVTTRVRAHLRAKQTLEEMGKQKRDLELIVAMSQAISAAPDNIFHVFVEKIAELMAVARCALLSVTGDQSKGLVVATFEDQGLVGREIPLEQHPEVQEALVRQHPVVINEVAQSPLVAQVRRGLQGQNIRSLMAIPVLSGHETLGALVFRASRMGRAFTARELALCESLVTLLHRTMENVLLVQSLRGANRELKELSDTDPLTQLYNQRHFYARLDEEFARAQRHGVPLACLMLDLDRFKEVNDRFGHREGDEVLKQVAAFIKAQTRKSDLVARYGGDEFVMLLPMTDEPGAKAEAERLQALLQALTVSTMAQEFGVTLSIGVAAFPSPAIRSSDDLIRAADQTLYRAKALGGACAVTFSSLEPAPLSLAPGLQEPPGRRPAALPGNAGTGAPAWRPQPAQPHPQATPAWRPTPPGGPERRSDAPAQMEPEVAPGGPARGRVVVVDAEAFVRRVVEEALLPEGYEVIGAASREQALRYLQGQPGGIVLTDLEPAAGGGVEFVRQIRRAFPEWRVMVMTEREADEKSLVAAMQAGAVEFLTKPFPSERLRAAVRRAFNHIL
ncbi:MAG: diguanylate cyclase [Deltaproteobacteria bacterium]|nr:diguanylate cyclase [Deltaproteobacteria bacterium]